MTEPVDRIDMVKRVVDARAPGAPPGRSVTISRTCAATVDELWDACTNPVRIRRWFLPVSGELRLHGRYQLEGNAGGTIERCDPPHAFAATWEFGGETSWIELRLCAEPDGGTRFELEHTVGAGDKKWAEFGPGALGVGWDLAVSGLATHLASGKDADRDRHAAWLASEDGRRFIARSSERWRDADVAAGADPIPASAAAQRTMAAYGPVPSG